MMTTDSALANYCQLASGPFSLNFTTKVSPEECLKELQENDQHIRSLIIDNQKKLDLDDFIDEIHEEYPQIPTLIITNESNAFFKMQGQELQTLNMPFELTELQDILAKQIDEIKNPPSHFQVGYQLITCENQSQFDIFVKTQSEKFLLLIKKDDPLYSKKLQLISNQERPFFLKQNDYITLSKIYAQEFFSQQSSNKTSLSEQVKGIQFVQEVTQALNISPIILSIVDKMRENLMANLNKKDRSLHKMINALLAEDNQLASHSLLISQISGKILGHTNFDYRTALEKITLASMLHDMELRKMGIKPVNKMTPAERKFYHLHPILAAQRLEENRHIPNDVCRIILEHHELPQRAGFPHKKQWRSLHALSQHFILIEFVVELIFLYGHSKDSFEQIRNIFSLKFKKQETNKTYIALMELLNC